MIDTGSDRNPLNDLAESFVERYRRGERPALSEYTRLHPELADEICYLFPALVLIEQAGPCEAGQSGASAAMVTADGRALERLGDYRILREVGRGGMGIVYEAEQEALGRHVALKVLPFQAAADPIRLQRFKREARSAARLHHTNIVPVFDVGECEGTHYYAMQFIQGQGLDDVLLELRRLRAAKTSPDAKEAARHGAEERTPAWNLTADLAGGLLTGQFPAQEANAGSSPEGQGAAGAEASKPRLATPDPGGAASVPGHSSNGSGSTSAILADRSDLSTQSDFLYYRSVARLGLQVAEALVYAHGQKILHRDIKPANLLLDLQGIAWVTDFGLAKEEGDDLTQTGDLVGTLRYMAPERFNGVSDARSDLYSLGLTLYELLTLRPAFDESDRGRLIKRVTHEEPPRPRKLDRRVPRDLETIVLKAIAREPGQRYASAEALAEDLRRFLADRPIQARRTMAWEQVWRWCRRNPAVASLTAAVALLLATVAVVSSVSSLRLNAELRRSEQAEQAEKDARQDATRALWKSYRDQAEARRLSRRMGQRFEGLKAIANAVQIGRELNLPEVNFLELRNEAIACLALPDLRIDDKEWVGWPEGPASLDFDGALERYVRTDDRGMVSVRRVADNEELYHFDSEQGGGWPLLSRDGRFLAIRYASRHKLWRLTGPEPVALPVEENACAHEFSPDSRWFVFVHPDGTLSLYDLTTGERVRRLNIGLCPSCLAFHPQHRWVAAAHSAGVQIRDLETGDALADLPVREAGYLAWHPDGKILAAVGDTRVIYLWDVASRQLIGRLEGCRNADVKLAFNPSGDLLASSGWENMLRLWDPRTGRQLFQTPASSWTMPAPRFRADGRFLAADVKGNQLAVWEVAARREYRTLSSNLAQGYGSCTLSPDGRVLAARNPSDLELWDLRTGGLLASVRLGDLGGVLFEPEGTLLTSRRAGVHRWALQATPAGSVQFGPPQQLPLLGNPWTSIARSRDGRVLASAQSWGALVLHADHPDQPIRLGPHEDARFVAVSRDGRWVVTGSHNGTGAKVWEIDPEVRTGKLVKDLLPRQRLVRVGFSPDDKWLVTVAEDVRLWAVDSWQETRCLGKSPDRAFAFSRDGKLLAVETGQGAVRLLNPETGREYARLEDPDQNRAGCICFSPDGAQLVTAGGDSSAVQVWDLRLIRQRLAELDLDWDLPSYEPAPAGPPPPLSVQVDYGDLLDREKYSLIVTLFPFDSLAYYRRGLAYVRFQQWAQARDDFSMALLLKPDLADAAYQRGLIHVQQRRYAQALEDFDRTLVLQPDHGDAHVQRGPLNACLQRWEKAAADFDQACERQPADWNLWLGRALAHLAREDHAGYRGACTGALERFRTTEDAVAAAYVSWGCALAPASGVDPAELVRLAEKAHAGNRGTYLYLRSLGLCLLRAGRFPEALERLEEASKAQADSPMTWLLLALVHHKLGHADEAHRWLLRAGQRIDEIVPKTPAEALNGLGSSRSLYWTELVGLRVLRREAEATIGEQATSSPRPPE